MQDEMDRARIEFEEKLRDQEDELRRQQEEAKAEMEKQQKR